MVEAIVPSVLNTIRNIFMRLYGSVEEVVTMCLVYKIWRLLCSYHVCVLCVPDLCLTHNFIVHDGI